MPKRKSPSCWEDACSFLPPRQAEGHQRERGNGNAVGDGCACCTRNARRTARRRLPQPLQPSTASEGENESNENNEPVQAPEGAEGRNQAPEGADDTNAALDDDEN